MDTKDLKKILADAAVEEYITNGMSIGLGTGSTAIWAVRKIAQKYIEGSLKNIVCCATGPGTRLEALKEGLPVFDLNSPSVGELDITIDGADEFDDDFYLVKGGGGCLLHEKLVAYSSKSLIIVAGEDKHVSQLGMSFPIPIEIIPVAKSRVETQLAKLFPVSDITLRLDARRIGPWITEEGNYILDCILDEKVDMRVLEKEIVQIVGVVEVGVFTQKLPTIISCDEYAQLITREKNTA